jgi:hypothetical protein
MSRNLLPGRIRRSTVYIALVFVLTLATYLVVRPIPASIAGTSPPTSPSLTTHPSTGGAPSNVGPKPTVSPEGAASSAEAVVGSTPATAHSYSVDAPAAPPAPSGAPISTVPPPSPAPSALAQTSP